MASVHQSRVALQEDARRDAIAPQAGGTRGTIVPVLEAVDQRLRQVLGAAVSEDEARAIGEWYATISEAVAKFPSNDLRAVEPPLRSTAAPRTPTSPPEQPRA